VSLKPTHAYRTTLFPYTTLFRSNHVFKTSDVYLFEYEYTFRDLQYGEAPDGAETFNAGKFYPENNEEIEFYITGIEPDSTLVIRSEEHTSELQSRENLVCRLLLE